MYYIQTPESTTAIMAAERWLWPSGRCRGQQNGSYGAPERSSARPGRRLLDALVLVVTSQTVFAVSWPLQPMPEVLLS